MLDAGQDPYAIHATANPDVMAYTNFLSDNSGLGLITGAESASPSAPGYSLALPNFNPDNPFGVHNAIDVTVTPDGLYAFVAAFNTPDSDVPSKNHYEPPEDPAGSNVGIFKFASPFQNPQLVGATRAIPLGLTQALTMSPDGQYLYAQYPLANVTTNSGDQGVGAVFVYNIAAIEAAVNNPLVQPLLSRFGIDDIDPGTGKHVDDKGIVQHNVAIDTQAAYGQINTRGNNIEFDVYDANHPPLGVGGLPRAWTRWIIRSPSRTLPAMTLPKQSFRQAPCASVTISRRRAI